VGRATLPFRGARGRRRADPPRPSPKALNLGQNLGLTPVRERTPESVWPARRRIRCAQGNVP
jgi:hypothetical protein